MTKTRVVVADDHPVVRAGIVALLGTTDDLDVVGEATTGLEAVELALALEPDVVLMDLRMPGINGDEATAQILASKPGIRSVARGEVALGPRIAALLVNRVQKLAAPSLSARETEVLRLVAQGHSNPAIAKQLFLSEATVKTHLLHAFEKLEVSDRTRAVTRAMELGLL